MAFLSCQTTHNYGYVIFAISDVLLIYAITNLLLSVSKYFYILNSILILLVNVELGVLYFSGSVVTLPMVQNINSARVLGGHAALYIGAIVAVLVFSFLPVVKTKPAKIIAKTGVLAAAIVFQFVLCIAMGINYSAWNSIYTLGKQQVTFWKMSSSQGEIKDEELFNETVSDDYRRPSTLSATPNIILIFTEGLSQNIIDDEREIMPNVAALQAESINFDNYYNHTFATFRALQGQLYSGYQLNDSDENHLISIQEILKNYGYYTAMINTEGANNTFSAYLEQMGFDDVLVDPDAEITSKTSHTESDKQSYEFLLKTAQELEEKNQPFFLAIYTIGTHASFDSPDEVFEDGSSNVLNRFYNTDYQFGTFFESFNNSELSDDTILIFTTDHSTFAEADYLDAFPDYTRECSDVDEVPLSIYYKGVEPQTIDAEGRNSLDLVPTILDFIDISGGNYFLGKSLFAEKTEELTYETVFYDPAFWKTTNGGVIADMESEDYDNMVRKVCEYFALITQ